MANPKSGKIFPKISKIFTTVVCILILLLLAITLINDPPHRGKDWILVGLLILSGLIFLPVFGPLLRKMGKTGEKIGPYFKGGLFIIRLAVLFIYTTLVVSEFNHIKRDAITLLHLKASKSQMAELVDYIDQDDFEGLETAIQNLRREDRKIDSVPLVARNFKTAPDHARQYSSTDDPDEIISGLEERLSKLNTMEKIRAALESYDASPYQAYIPVKDMINLLREYGDNYIKADRTDAGREYYNLAAALDPENAGIILAEGDALFDRYYLQEAADVYNRYMSLMRNDGKDRQIPSRVRDFIRSERYGSKLQSDLITTWVNAYPAEPAESGYDETQAGNDILVIDGKVYGSLWQNGHGLIYGFEFWNGDDWEQFNGLVGCVAKLLGRNLVKDSPAILEQLTGLEFLSDRNDQFMHINGEIIEWAQKNLIPDPSLRILGHYCQEFYDVMLKNRIRETATGYSFLNGLYSFEDEAYNYEEAMEDETFYGFGYLEDRYMETARYNLDDYEKAWETTVQAGFWLRREIDGSRKACWDAMNTLLREYDPEFMEYGYYRDWYSMDEEYEEEGDYSDEGY